MAGGRCATPFVVTTARNPTRAHLARATSLSSSLGAPLVPRLSMEAMVAQTGCDLFYMVGREREELRRIDGARCFVQPGLVPSKLVEGTRHPFIRALRGDDDVIASVFDCTLGLANDALHAAVALNAHIHGAEASPVLAALLEEGLVRMANEGRAWSGGAARIRMSRGGAVDVLGTLEAGSVDVVMLDPMMKIPRKAAPPFQLLRAFAFSALASGALLTEAARVARRRVVLKLDGGAPLPLDAPWPPTRSLVGAHVTYHVYEVRQ